MTQDNAPKSTPKRRMRSFEADADVARMLDDAVASGATQAEIINSALREHGPEMLRGHAKKLRAAAARLEKTIGAKPR